MNRQQLSMLTRNTVGAAALVGATVMGGAGSATAAPLTTHTTTSALGTLIKLSPASAQDAYGCPTGFSCYYDGAPGFGKFYTESANCQFTNLGTQGMGDRTSSIVNLGNTWVQPYNWGASAGWIPVGLPIPPGYGFVLNGALDNITDAVRVCP